MEYLLGYFAMMDIFNGFDIHETDVNNLPQKYLIFFASNGYDRVSHRHVSSAPLERHRDRLTVKTQDPVTGAKRSVGQDAQS